MQLAELQEGNNLISPLAQNIDYFYRDSASQHWAKVIKGQCAARTADSRKSLGQRHNRTSAAPQRRGRTTTGTPCSIDSMKRPSGRVSPGR
jgi:hypothetical protein